MNNIDIDYNEKPSIQKEHEGPIWKRTGYCCQCGECCIDCPAVVWIVPGKRGVCGDRMNGLPQRCGQDKTWPPSPGQVAHCPNCSYKFEIVKENAILH